MTDLVAVICAILMVGGAMFCLVAAIGVLRLPDLFMRMHASTKAGTLGAGMLLVAVALHFGAGGVTARALVTIAFLVLTAPVAAHMIARAGYYRGTQLWKGTITDALKPNQTQRADRESPEQVQNRN